MLRNSAEIFIAIFLSIILCGCGTSKEVTSQTTEEAITQPIKVEVPKLNTVIDAPLIIQPDTSIEVFETIKDVEQKNEDGTKTQATVRIKTTIKNDNGKKTAQTNLEVQQAPIQKDAQVIKRITNTNITKEKQGFFDGLTGLMKWVCVFILLVSVMWIILKVKKII
jgi:hypothetical protein